jgi:catechol 2,3-dioxygenase-like lactoylglutathione lyase family enzyme
MTAEAGARVDLRLEVVVVPVRDVERARAFYAERAGFRVDHDTVLGEGMRIVQLTPPGSACSIAIGTVPPLPAMAPGSLRGLQLVVDDMAAAYAELQHGGVELGEVVELGRPGRPGFKFAYFSDPDGNGWAVQEIRPDQA